jgi:hypothetical protein
MMRLLLLAHALFVVSVPAIVVRVVGRAARAAAPAAASLPSKARRRLWLATALVGAGLVLWLGGDARALSAGPPAPALGIVELTAFAVLGLGFGWPALSEANATAAEVARVARRDRPPEAVRSASLRPRRVSDYLPRSLQSVPFGIVLAGLMLLAGRLAQPPAGDRRLLLPVCFALGAVVFSFLYAAWMRDEARLPDAWEPTEPVSSREPDRGRSIRRIFAVEVGLAGAFSILALILVDVDWASSTGALVGVAAALLGGAMGVLGCARVLASDVSRRKLAADAREIWR